MRQIRVLIVLLTFACAGHVQANLIETLGSCPGNRQPDVSQAGFDALPESTRNNILDGDTEARRYVLCGQYVYDLLTQDTYTSEGLADADQRRSTLEQVDLLLGAGIVPRTPSGLLGWWDGATHFLTRNEPMRPDGPSELPYRSEYYALFAKRILPNLPRLTNEETDGRAAQYFVKHAIWMPTPLALETLRKLKDWGILGWNATYGSPNIALENLHWALDPTVSDEVFRLVREEVGPSPEGMRNILNDVIAANNTVGLKRLLDTGADPLEVIETAQEQKKPELYEILRQAAMLHGSSVPEYVDSDAVWALVESTYTCHSELVVGQKIEGKGRYGCYFILRDTRTGQVLTNTPYDLELRPQVLKSRPTPIIGIRGITDEQGRTAYFRSSYPFKPNDMALVQVIGDGRYSRSFQLVRHAGENAANAINQRYRLDVCGDSVYEGVTDAQGHTVMITAAKACTINVGMM